MAVEINTYLPYHLVDVQTPRTSILSIKFWIPPKSNLRRNYEFVLARYSVYVYAQLTSIGTLATLHGR